MSTTLATNIEQSVSAQQLTTTDTEQALYHLHHQYQEQYGPKSESAESSNLFIRKHFCQTLKM
mgnify:CR=1 FL=1